MRKISKRSENMKKLLLIGLFILITSSLIMFGCSGGSTPTTTTATTTPPASTTPPATPTGTTTQSPTVQSALPAHRLESYASSAARGQLCLGIHSGHYQYRLAY